MRTLVYVCPACGRFQGKQSHGTSRIAFKCHFCGFKGTINSETRIYWFDSPVEAGAFVRVQNAK